MSIWAPVVAAVGASGLTGALGFGAIWWQQRRADRTATLARKNAAYQQLISRSLSFVVRSHTLRTVMQVRSGVREGVDVASRLRRPADVFELHDWLAQDFDPINEAWATVQVFGSVNAVAAATRVLDACADLLNTATRPGQARGRVTSVLKGLAWTPEQQRALTDATQRVVDEREAFIRLAREELNGERAAEVASAPGA